MFPQWKILASIIEIWKSEPEKSPRIWAKICRRQQLVIYEYTIQLRSYQPCKCFYFTAKQFEKLKDWQRLESTKLEGANQGNLSFPSFSLELKENVICLREDKMPYANMTLSDRQGCLCIFCISSGWKQVTETATENKMITSIKSISSALVPSVTLDFSIRPLHHVGSFGKFHNDKMITIFKLTLN